MHTYTVVCATVRMYALLCALFCARTLCCVRYRVYVRSVVCADVHFYALLCALLSIRELDCVRCVAYVCTVANSLKHTHTAKIYAQATTAEHMPMVSWCRAGQLPAAGPEAAARGHPASRVHRVPGHHNRRRALAMLQVHVVRDPAYGSKGG